jgi:hypothetical protein
VPRPVPPTLTSPSSSPGPSSASTASAPGKRNWWDRLTGK